MPMTATRRSSLAPSTWPHDLAGRIAPAAASADVFRNVRREVLMVCGCEVGGKSRDLGNDRAVTGPDSHDARGHRIGQPRQQMTTSLYSFTRRPAATLDRRGRLAGRSTTARPARSAPALVPRTRQTARAP